MQWHSIYGSYEPSHSHEVHIGSRQGPSSPQYSPLSVPECCGKLYSRKLTYVLMLDVSDIGWKMFLRMVCLTSGTICTPPPPLRLLSHPQDCVILPDRGTKRKDIHTQPITAQAAIIDVKVDSQNKHRHYYLFLKIATNCVRYTDVPYRTFSTLQLRYLDLWQGKQHYPMLIFFLRW